MEEEIPKYKKKSKKKSFAVKWTCLDEPPANDLFGKILSRPFTQKYSSRKAAEQAIEVWKNGGGTWAHICKAPYWKAELITL